MSDSETITRRRCAGMLAAAATGAGFAGCQRLPAPDLGSLIFPDDDWQESPPEDLGLSSGKLQEAAAIRDGESDESGHHFIVIRNGHLVFQHSKGVDRQKPRGVASLGKSVYTSMLGIAIDEGKIAGLDEKVVAAYPEIRGATGEFGPYPDAGRYFSEHDEHVTFRHLATHTGGFMKADYPPGTAWDYDTFGMSTLMHAISKQYGHYDSSDPDPVSGCGELINRKIRDPIEASWKWKYTNFPNHAPEAKLNLFGNYVTLRMTVRQDLARLGLLWLANGRWKDQQVIPEDWHLRSTRVAPIIKQCAPEEDWKYGFGFWVNEFGRLWPNLPRDSYMAAGFPGHRLWICPSLSLVVAESPGLPGLPGKEAFEDFVAEGEFLEKIVAAIQS